MENKLESVVNEAIFLISIGDSSVKLARNGEPNNLYQYLARDGHKESAYPAEVIKWKTQSFHVSAHNAITRNHSNSGRDKVTFKPK